MATAQGSVKMADAFHIPDMEERLPLIRQLEIFVRTSPQVVFKQFNPCAWAMLHIMPLEKLKYEVSQNPLTLWYTINNSSQCIAHFLIRPGAFDTKNDARASSPRDLPQNYGSPSKSAKRKRVEDDYRLSSSGIPSTPTHQRIVSDPMSSLSSSKRISSPGRSEPAKKLCRERDNGKCVITGWPDAHIAHIFPFGSISNSGPKRDQFWAFLKYIWGSEKHDTWLAHARDNVSNLLCLTQTLHAYWGNARFALKPIPVDQENILKFEFHWLKSMPKDRAKNIIPSLCTPVSELLVKHGLPEARTSFPPQSSKLPASGSVFTMTSNSPDHPLPSFELLELQWHLQRIAAMTAAADMDFLKSETGFDDSDPDDAGPVSTAESSDDEYDDGNSSSHYKSL